MPNLIINIIKDNKWTFCLTLLIINIITLVFNNSQTPLKEATLILQLEKEILKDAFEKEMLFLQDDKFIKRIIEKIEVFPQDKQKEKFVIDRLLTKYKTIYKVQKGMDNKSLIIKSYDKNAEKSKLIASAFADTYILDKNNKASSKNKALMASLTKRRQSLNNQILHIRSSIDDIPSENKVISVNETAYEKLNEYLLDVNQAGYLKANGLKESILKLEKTFINDNENDIYPFYSKKDFPEASFLWLMNEVLTRYEFEIHVLDILRQNNSKEAKEINKNIVEIKAGLLNIIKTNYPKPLTPKTETDIALLIKKIILEHELKAINLNIIRAYKKDNTLNETQNKYNNLIQEAKSIIAQYLQVLSEINNMNIKGSYQLDKNFVFKQAEITNSNSKNAIRINYLLSSLMIFLLNILYYLNRENKSKAKPL